jgi:hypothetical protein
VITPVLVPGTGRLAAPRSLRAIWAMRSGSGGRGSVPDRITVKAVDGVPDELLNGLPGETARLLAAAPITDKRLLELSVTWTGLSRGRARMAAALRVFVITWDPLEFQAPRPYGFAAVNVGSLGLEIAVYVPCWRLAELAKGRNVTIAAVIGQLAGSAVVTAAEHEEDVVAGRYPDLAVARAAPDLLADPEAGVALGVPRIQADPSSWEDIGLGAISDIVQHAFGPVDLDRSLVELAILSPESPGCPACAGRRFGFPADLGESQAAMCETHRREADAVTEERLRRANRSNPPGWTALGNATIRHELPHLPNGLATRLTSAEPSMYVTPSRDELAELAGLIVTAAGWFPANPGDLAIALGEDPDSAPGFPDWLANLVLELGRAGLGAEVVRVGEALATADPESRPVIEADIAVALAHAGLSDDARAGVEMNVSRWPDHFSVRLQAGEALALIGDLNGAAAQFEAALGMADQADDFVARADAMDQIRRLERRRSRESGSSPRAQRRQQPTKPSRSQRRRRS